MNHYHIGIESKDTLTIDGKKKSRPFDVAAESKRSNHRATITFLNRGRKLQSISAVGKIVDKGSHKEFIYHSV